MKKMILSVFFFCLSTSVWAHKINLFVDVEGNQASVAGYFADGKVPKQSPISVFDETDTLLLEGQTNNDAEFEFVLPTGKKGIRVKIDAGMGHVAEYAIPDADLQTEEASSSIVSAPNASPEATATPDQSNKAMPIPMDQRKLSKMIEKAVAKANRPLRRSLDEMKKGASLSDIIGGLGLIFGALGLWFFLQARKLQAANTKTDDSV